ncbi:MobC family plasmid mobilization relaxosome protein [Lactococcus lactis]|uniref:plasmid mobilization protein n=1 Tax=Lactococcus lactis TaxID=1358 RepID=UPI0022DFB30F|nr:plasmid mobilization relaxosome protein MobC [Lactococcus lactis]MCG6978380.1 MobC family plasmid mobilization relaxosome protein [Lactococcus lactis]
MTKKRKRNIPFQFYVDSNEEFIIREKAGRTHKNLSDYLRSIAIKGAIYEVNFEEIDEFSKQISQLRFEFNRIGNNINQIAKKANLIDEVDQEDMEVLQDEMGDIQKNYRLLSRKVLKEIQEVVRKLEE